MKNLATIAFLLFLGFVYPQEKIPYIDYDDIALKINAAAGAGNFEAVLGHIDKLSKNDSAYYTSLVTKSYYLIRLKRFDEAIAVTDEGLSAGYAGPRANFYQNKGAALLELEKYQEAVDLYAKAIKEYPKNHIFYYNKGVVLERLEQFDEAVAMYKQAIMLNPYYAKSHFQLGNICYKQHRTAQALMCFNTYLLLNPDGENAFAVLKMLNDMVSRRNESPVQPDLRISADDGTFDEIDLILDNRIALSENYTIDNKITIALTKQNHALLEKLNDYKGNGGFWDTRYVPLYKWIRDNNHFDSFIYTIAYSIENETYKKIIDKNIPEIKAFIDAFRDTWGAITKDNEQLFNGKKQTVTHYFNNFLLNAVGVMKNGRTVGYWEIYDDDGRLSATGSFDDKGERTGEWTWFYPGGKTKEKARYANGALNGENYTYYPDGKKNIVANYKNGQLDGIYEIYNNKGALVQRKFFTEGALNGTFTSFYPVGETAVNYTLPYKNDKAEGLMTEYYASGEKSSEILFKNDAREGVEKSYYINSNIHSETTYSNGKFHGPYKSYYNNGTLEETGQGIDDEATGNWKIYHENGTLKNDFNYDNGLINGVYKEYDDDGKPFYEYTYRKGEVIAYTFFNKKGAILKEAKKRGGEFLYEGYNSNGNLTSKGLYDIKGGKKGVWEYYSDNGVLSGKGFYEDDKVEGEYTRYYNNGSPESVEQYKTDSLTGYYVDYYTFGQMKTQGWYKNNSLHGEWRTYYPDGTLSGINYYHKGKLHGEQQYFGVNGKLYRILVYEYNTLLAEKYFDENGALSEAFDFNREEPEYTLESHHFNGSTESRTSYRYGVKQGAYSVYDYDGHTMIEGNYVNDNQHGKWTWYYANGNKNAEGSFINGERHGPWFHYHENGTLALRCFYEYGKATGTWEDYSETGVLTGTTTYKNDQLHGEKKFYSPEGKLQLIRYYDRGRLIGYSFPDKNGTVKPMTGIANETAKIASYFDNGNSAREMEFKNGDAVNTYKSYYYSGALHNTHFNSDGEYHGENTTYYPDGTIKEKDTYFYGYLHGPSQEFYENGTLKEVVNYLNNVREGEASYYNEKGKLIKTEYYFNGAVVNVKKIKDE